MKRIVFKLIVGFARVEYYSKNILVSRDERLIPIKSQISDSISDDNLSEVEAESEGACFGDILETFKLESCIHAEITRLRVSSANSACLADYLTLQDDGMPRVQPKSKYIKDGKRNLSQEL